ncbi:MAG: ribulose-phosphate 3-epimerase [Chitinispirillaceae bacterium]|nr:ribulose-phosphate 3-epimerase [Chitinispirillaceae bacterium]
MDTKRIQIFPSILAADFSCLECEVKAAQDAGADRIHCDVMDGHFVPNLTFGPIVVEAVRRCVTIPLDVHLMMDEPQKYIDDFCNAGANALTVHAEVCGNDLPAVLDRIRGHGVRRGVSVNPDKPISLFTDHLAIIDQVLIMTVFAGFGGQDFIDGSLEKIAALYAETQKRNPSCDIEVDGGINEKTAYLVAKSGANLLVAGTYVFGHQDSQKRIQALREAAQRGAAECTVCGSSQAADRFR